MIDRVPSLANLANHAEHLIQYKSWAKCRNVSHVTEYLLLGNNKVRLSGKNYR